MVAAPELTRWRVDGPLSVAPMMDITDRHFRFLLRQITSSAVLYSEMVTAAAVVYGDSQRLLERDACEAPVVLQLGGSDPDLLARAAELGAAFGYDAINLNVGCPSERVSSGRFGACLMKEPALVAECVAAMRGAVSVPVTVKHRIGVDDRESFGELLAFVDEVAAAGCGRFIVHARKAWLAGLSPKENRTVPPLRYDVVSALKAARPELPIEINGGVTDLEQARLLLGALDGVMIGRAVHEDPLLLVGADALVAAFWASAQSGRSGPGTSAGSGPSVAAATSGPDGEAAITRESIVVAMLPYVEAECQRGAPLNAMSRHMLKLFKGQLGGRAWRRVISENAHKPGAGPELLAAALAQVPLEVRQQPLAGTLRGEFVGTLGQ